jgi:cytochrome c551
MGMILRFIGISFLLVACGGERSSGEFDTPEGYQSRSGKQIFTKHCVACHGTDGKKGTAGAKDLTASTMDSVSIVDLLKNGKNSMPRQIQFMKTEQELGNTINYLKSLRR